RSRSRARLRARRTRPPPRARRRCGCRRRHAAASRATRHVPARRRAAGTTRPAWTSWASPRDKTAASYRQSRRRTKTGSSESFREVVLAAGFPGLVPPQRDLIDVRAPGRRPVDELGGLQRDRPPPDLAARGIAQRQRDGGIVGREVELEQAEIVAARIDLPDAHLGAQRRPGAFLGQLGQRGADELVEVVAAALAPGDAVELADVRVAREQDDAADPLLDEEIEDPVALREMRRPGIPRRSLGGAPAAARGEHLERRLG